MASWYGYLLGGSPLPNSTWNGSWKKRPALQITGSMTDETVQLIREATSETVYRV